MSYWRRSFEVEPDCPPYYCRSDAGPLQHLTDRLSAHESRLSSTGLLLAQLEQQLRQVRCALMSMGCTCCVQYFTPACSQELNEAASVAEAQQRSEQEANRPRPVPLCEIALFAPVGATEATSVGPCCICDEGYADEVGCTPRGGSEGGEAGGSEGGGGGRACRLPSCGHIFHRGCVSTWLRIKNTCPMCRHEVSSKLPYSTPRTTNFVVQVTF